MTTVNVLLPTHKINLLQVNSCHYDRGFWYVSSLKIMHLLHKVMMYQMRWTDQTKLTGSDEVTIHFKFHLWEWCRHENLSQVTDNSHISLTAHL